MGWYNVINISILSSLIILLSVWGYLILNARRLNLDAPWEFVFVILGVPLAGMSILVAGIPLSVLLMVMLFAKSIKGNYFIQLPGTFKNLLRISYKGLLLGLLLVVFWLILPHDRIYPAQYQLWLSVIYAIQASIGEEIQFRGIFYGLLNKHSFTFLNANLLQTTVFLLLHIPRYLDGQNNTAAILFVSIFSFLSGYLTWKERNIWGSIVMHITINVSLVMVEVLNFNGG